MSTGTEMQHSSVNLILFLSKTMFILYQPEHNLANLLHFDGFIGTCRSSENTACQSNAEFSFELFTVNSVDEGVVAAAAHREPVEGKEHDIDILPCVD